MPSLYDLERASHDIPRERLARAAQYAQVRLLQPTPRPVRAALALAGHVTQAIAGSIRQRRRGMGAVAPITGR